MSSECLGISNVFVFILYNLIETYTRSLKYTMLPLSVEDLEALVSNLSVRF